jgi:hypothetical protein
MEKSMFLKIKDFPARNLQRAFVPLYYAESVNHCPACAKSNWHIGRSTAECAFCETALPLAVTSVQPMQPMFTSRCSQTAMAA